MNGELKGGNNEKFVIKICDLREHYDVKEEVGRGKFGVVHKVVKKTNGEIHAAKFIKIAHGKRKDVLHEVEIMRKLSHEHLVNLIDVFDMDKRIILIMEFISGGELFERIVEEDNLTESEAVLYMKQILEGLQHMHGKNIVHLDLKPENVVCIEPRSTKIKLIDFGLARQLEHGKETKITCGTPEFVAPEVLNFDPVTLASDMWSVGVIAYILISGLSPFLGDTDSETFVNVSSCEWDFDDECFEDVSDESKDFIEGLIVSIPRKRRNVEECLQHKWIKDYNAKSSKKLKVDNLRKFLAKKRWQKSVNAVRAIRRLSSFGASLLGKSSSLIRSKTKSGISDSPSSSINEETEAFESQVVDCCDISNDYNNGVDESVVKPKTTVKSNLDADHCGPQTAGLDKLRRNFQSLSQVLTESSSSITESSSDRLKSNGEVICEKDPYTPGKELRARGVSTESDVLKESVSRGDCKSDLGCRNEIKRVSSSSVSESSKYSLLTEDKFAETKRIEDQNEILNSEKGISSREVLDSGYLPSNLESKDHHKSHKDIKDLTVINSDKTSLISKEQGYLAKVDEIKRTDGNTEIFNSIERFKLVDHNIEASQEEFNEDVTTKDGLRSYLQRMINEGKLPGNDSDFNMPRPVSWSCSNAASKRASFRDILTVSASEELTESEDEEPIKIEVLKLKFEDQYEVQEEIGRGRFGVVNKVVEKATGKFFAAKYIKVRAATRDLVRQEIEVLCSMRHRRIVKLHAAFEESRKFILVLELVAGGELFEKLSEEEQISENEAVFFIKQILQGVKSMHKSDVLHLDLKPENVMLVDSSSAEIKIIDFGLAKKFDPNQDIKVLSGTPAFAAPEVINFEKITKATDIWSIGVIAYVLLSGLSPFLGENMQDTCSNVTGCQWDFEHHSFDKVSSEAKDFICKIIIKDPKKRMTVEECIDHPWIKNSSKKKQSEIKTRPLFRFTRSFTQTFIDGDEELRPPLVRSQKIDAKRTHSNLQDITETKEEKLSSKNPDMMGTDDHGLSDRQRSLRYDSIDNIKSIAALEERLKTTEAERDDMKRRFIRQTDLQTEVELMKHELEKSLDAHAKLQEAILTYEQDKIKLLEKTRLQGREINRLELKYETLKQELDEKSENYDSLNRKYKRIQERLERAEEMEETIAGLHRDKTRKLDKINELEEKVIELSEMKNKINRDDDKSRRKLEKDYKALQDINESCHQELEEMDERLSALENENTKLRKELKQAKEEHVDEDLEELKERIDEMEERNNQLDRKLANEMKNKQLIESERDSIEEEFEEERRNLESKIEKIVNQNERLEEEKREIVCLLEASKKSYFKLDEELIELKKAKRKETETTTEGDIKKKDDLIFDLNMEREALKKDIDRLNNKMLALMEERQKLEEEVLSKDKGTADRRQSGSNRDVERIKSDLKMTQEYLRIATDTNTELQLQMKKLKTDHETELHIQLIEQEARLTNSNEQEIERVKEAMIVSNDIERKELEDRITVQDFAISKLQALLELREQEEDAVGNQEIIPVAINGNANDSASYVKKSTRNTINVKISPDVRVSVSEEADEDESDTLSERELRRISYKIADGSWSNLGQVLGLQDPEYEDIMVSSCSEQEKVYRLLVLWKAEAKQPRCVLVSQLTVAIEKMRRRDIVKFVKDFNSRDQAGLSIRKRIKKFIK